MVQRQDIAPRPKRVRLPPSVWLVAALVLHEVLAVTAHHFASNPTDTGAENEELPTPQSAPTAGWEQELVVWLEDDGYFSTTQGTSSHNTEAHVPHEEARNHGAGIKRRLSAQTHQSSRLDIGVVPSPMGSSEPVERAGTAPHSEEAQPNTQRPHAMAQNPIALGFSAPGASPNYDVVRAELERTIVNPQLSAQARLDQALTQGLLENDRLALASLDAAARRLVLTAMRSSSLQLTTPLVVKFVTTPQGKIEQVQVSSRASVTPSGLNTFASSLGGLPFSAATTRPVQFTFELDQRAALASGRSAGTGLSIGPFQAMKPGATDSPKVAVLPRKNQLLSPLKLSRDRTESERDPALPAIVEQTLLDLDGDLVDAFTTGERVVRIKLLKRQVL